MNDRITDGIDHSCIENEIGMADMTIVNKT